MSKAPAPPPPAPAAPAPEAVAPPPAPRGKKKKKPKVSPQMYKFYKVQGDSLKRLKQECPRCGKGRFLAEHKNRLSCGNCSYTSFKKS
ncbi:MAG: 30S ribosomal protein S27ae [Thaumarchaeota archaeon]|nr:30S ribosomal protein S27ae [Nitrososphaerota archaeon]